MQKEKSQKEKKLHKCKHKKLIIFLIIIIVILLGSSAGYIYWQNKKIDKERNEWKNKNGDLENQISRLSEDLDDANQRLDEASKQKDADKKVTIPQSLRENIEAAISSKNTSALEGYMAKSVNVVMAASEKMGPRTPAQAISDLEYINQSTGSWNFNIPASSLSKYKSGAYGQYFEDNTVVGQSKDKYLVSFGIDSNSKISTIFMAGDYNLLQ